jgi:hypothetical protein
MGGDLGVLHGQGVSTFSLTADAELLFVVNEELELVERISR